MNAGDSETEFAGTSPETQFYLTFLSFDLEELINTIICVCLCKIKNNFLYLRYKIFPSSILPFLSW